MQNQFKFDFGFLNIKEYPFFFQYVFIFNQQDPHSNTFRSSRDRCEVHRILVLCAEEREEVGK